MFKYRSFTSSGVGINTQPVILQAVKSLSHSFPQEASVEVLTLLETKQASHFKQYKTFNINFTNNNKKIHV